MSAESDSARARCGWESDFPTFSEAEPRVVRISLQDFLADAGDSQIRAWDDSIPKIQVEVGEVVEIDELAEQYTAILEYELPLESRRPDVVLLVNGAVVVLELKGKTEPEQADLDQAAAYARDLRCYHRHCADREVHAVVVPTRAHGYVGVRDGVHIAGPDALHELIQKLQRPWEQGPLTADEFLAKDAYCPLPTLVQAARELFLDGKIRPIHRARAETQPAIDAISAIAHEAARTRTRHLVLVAGVPGSGKTLVGPERRPQPRPRRPEGRARRRQATGAGHLPQRQRTARRGAAVRAAQRRRRRQDLRPRRQELREAVSRRQGRGPAAARDRLRRGAARLGSRAGDQQASRHPRAQVRAGGLRRVRRAHPRVVRAGRAHRLRAGDPRRRGGRPGPVARGAAASRLTGAVDGARATARAGRVLRGPVAARAARRPARPLDLTVELRFHFAADLDEWVDGLLTDGDDARTGASSPSASRPPATTCA